MKRAPNRTYRCAKVCPRGHPGGGGGGGGAYSFVVRISHLAIDYASLARRTVPTPLKDASNLLGGIYWAALLLTVGRSRNNKYSLTYSRVL